MTNELMPWHGWPALTWFSRNGRACDSVSIPDSQRNDGHEAKPLNAYGSATVDLSRLTPSKQRVGPPAQLPKLDVPARPVSIRADHHPHPVEFADPSVGGDRIALALRHAAQGNEVRTRPVKPVGR